MENIRKLCCVCPWHLWVMIQDKVKSLEGIRGVQALLEVRVILGACGFLAQGLGLRLHTRAEATIGLS